MKDLTKKWLDYAEENLASKYPLGNVLPDFEPDQSICERCITMAEVARDFVRELLGQDQ